MFRRNTTQVNRHANDEIRRTIVRAVKRYWWFVPVLFVGLVAAGYYYNWDWTGLGDYTHTINGNQEFERMKTLWDWMQLLIIPAALAAGAWWVNQRRARTELDVVADNQREAALETYIDNMSELLLDQDLRASGVDDARRHVARVRTLLALRRLDNHWC